MVSREDLGYGDALTQVFIALRAIRHRYDSVV